MSKTVLSNPFADAATLPVIGVESALPTRSPLVGTKNVPLPPGLGSAAFLPPPQFNNQRRHRRSDESALIDLETFGLPAENDWSAGYLRRAEPKAKTFRCPPCSRDFDSAKQLADHVDEHEVCGIDGCPYEAHPKLVLNHFKAQHTRPGLAERVWRVTTPEDVARWREERRRNYPTTARTAKRAAEVKARKKRGNVLDTAYFGKCLTAGAPREARRGWRGFGRGFRGQRGGGPRGSRGARGGVAFRPNTSGKAVDDEFDDEDSSGDDDDDALLDPLRWSRHVDDEDEAKVDSSIFKADKNSATGVTKSESSGILGSLAASYASSSEDEEVEGVKDGVTESRPNARTDDGRNGAKESIASPDVASGEKKGLKRKRKRTDFGRLLTDAQVSRQLTKFRQRRQPTLLERLLAPEIRRERNLILQCVHYVVRKNFFEE